MRECYGNGKWDYENMELITFRILVSLPEQIKFGQNFRYRDSDYIRK